MVLAGRFNPIFLDLLLELPAKPPQIKTLYCWGTTPSNMSLPCWRAIHASPPCRLVDLETVGDGIDKPFTPKTITCVFKGLHAKKVPFQYFNIL